MASDPQLRRKPERVSSPAKTAGVRSVRAALLAVSPIAVFSGLLAAAQLASLRGSKATHETDFLTTATESPQDFVRFVRKPSRETTLDPNVRVT
jgi:hypothetical protein